MTAIGRMMVTAGAQTQVASLSLIGKQIAEKLETLSKSVPNAKQIAFDGLSSWMTDVDSITIKKAECC